MAANRPQRSDSWQMGATKPVTICVLGAQWGDEGKGKLVDILAAAADVCARFNGGANAGHTLVVGGEKYPLHLTPCGILYQHTENLIGNGVVLHLKTLVEELNRIEKHHPGATKRVFLSDRAHLLFDVHQKVDGLQEAEKAGTGLQIGTTKRGIGPCYAAKMARIGIRVADLLEWPVFEKKYRALVAEYKKRFPLEHDEEEELARHKEYSEMFRKQVVDGVAYMTTKMSEQKKVLLEGANATMLDIDFGTYPYVTSSSTVVGGASIGLGIPPKRIDLTIGVVKAYLTRVGEGPFPTELHDEVGQHLLNMGHEFGTTTGRPRRCGWFDVALLRYVNAISGFDMLNLTKLDVLTGLKELKICTSYTLDGKRLADCSWPATVEVLQRLVPTFETLPGWSEPIDKVTRFEDLPTNARRYVERLEELVRVPIAWIGVGPDRVNTINRAL